MNVIRMINSLTAESLQRPDVRPAGATPAGAMTPASALTAGAPSAGGSATAGTKSFKVTFRGPWGETPLGSKSNVVTFTAANGTSALSVIATGPAGTTGRNIYATKSGDNSAYFLWKVIEDNTTTTASFADADTALQQTFPEVPPHRLDDVGNYSALTNPGEATIAYDIKDKDASVFIYGDTNVTGDVRVQLSARKDGPWADFPNGAVTNPTTDGGSIFVPSGSGAFLRVLAGGLSAGGPARANLVRSIRGRY